MPPSSAQRRIIFLVLLFLVMGEIMLFSATGVMGLQRYGSEFYFVVRQALCALIGLALMFLVSKIRYQVWGKLAYIIMAIQLVLIGSTLFSHFGYTAQGASRWLRLGPLSFQPSELAKITLAIYLGRLLVLYKQRPFIPKQWVVHGLLILVLLFMIYRQPDLGSTILLVSMMLGLAFIGGLRLLYLFGFIGVGASFFVFSMLHSDYRRRRLMAFLNPWADPQGSGFQTIQSFLSFHSGKIFGTGIGNGNSKLFFLPEVHTDFIYSLIGEELGFVGAIVLLVLFVYFTYLLFKVAFRAPDAFGCYLAFALALSLVLQVAVNLGGVTGILPVKGLPLPFISWGRSALIVDLIMVGILLNIAKQSGIIRPSQGG